MRRSDRRLRGELGGCHLLMLLLKIFFFPRLCKAPPSIQLGRRRSRGCSAVPGGWGQWQGCAGGDIGGPGAPGSAGGFKKPVGFAFRGGGDGARSLHPPGMLGLVLHCSGDSRPRDSDTSRGSREPRERIRIRGRPREEKSSTGLCSQHGCDSFPSTTKPFCTLGVRF